jgi:hypothetical protein
MKPVVLTSVLAPGDASGLEVVESIGYGGAFSTLIAVRLRNLPGQVPWVLGHGEEGIVVVEVKAVPWTVGKPFTVELVGPSDHRHLSFQLILKPGDMVGPWKIVELLGSGKLGHTCKVEREDHKPVVVDLGSAWLPGGSTLTVGLAPGTPHMLPPECVAFIREGSWKQGARFAPGQAGALYQLGIFLYEALAECWPFAPRLAKDELLAAASP